MSDDRLLDAVEDLAMQVQLQRTEREHPRTLAEAHQTGEIPMPQISRDDLEIELLNGVPRELIAWWLRKNRFLDYVRKRRIRIVEGEPAAPDQPASAAA